MNKLERIAVALFGLALALSMALNVALIGRLKEESEMPPIHLSRRISANELHHLLSEKFPYARIFITDEWYYLISKRDFDRLLAYDKTDCHRYIRVIYDCDDFAFDFWRNITRHYHIAMGVAFVLTGKGAHAINFYVDENCSVYLIEPQSDQYVQYDFVYQLLF